MTALENVFAEPILQALGWTLIHFIWQGVLLVALTASLNGMLGGRRANTRYLVVCAAMLLMLALPIATFCIIRSSSHVEAVSLQMIQEAQGESQTFFTATWPLAATASQPQALTFYDRLRPLLPWLISLWFMGVVALSLRLLFGWKYAQYLKARTTRSVSQWYEDMFADLCWKLRVSRPVRLLESAIVEVPTVIGWLKPVLLLPTSALTGLTPQQLEAILAHELAHIRRHDYLVNLLQSVVEVLLFYHPGVWWVSKQIRAERENCCDDMAVTVCGDMLTYTRALTQMEKLRGVRREFALAANGGDLLMRIQRLAQGPAPRATHSGWLLIIVAAIAAVITVGARPGSMSNSAGTDIARPAAEAFAPQDRLPLSKADYKASGSQSFAKVDQNKLFDASSQNAPIQQVAFTQANGERARKQDQASEAVTS